MAEISKKASKPRLTEGEINVKRAERAAKKAQAEEDADGDMVSGHTLKYTFGEHVLDIQEDWSGETSGMQWLGGVALARYFDNREVFPSGFWCGKRVLEVGAGCGLTGILLTLLGADVTITDIDIGKAAPNIDMNIKDEEVKKRVHLMRVDWFEPELDRFQLPFDIIVSGDCYYQAAVVNPLLRMMWDVSDENTAIYHCGIVSNTVLIEFNKYIDNYFEIERLDPSPTASSTASSSSGSVSLVDLPDTRLRALMRFHRRPEIQSKSEIGNVLGGPFLLCEGNAKASVMEIHMCSCSRVMQRELEHIFPEMTNTESIIAIPTNQRCKYDLVKVGEDIADEKDRCLEVFAVFAKQLCDLLVAKGYWADYIDPCSGLPMLTPNTTKCYSEVQGMQTLLRYKTMDAGMCKVLLHPSWGSFVYPATAFTDAPLDVLTQTIQQVISDKSMASSTSS